MADASSIRKASTLPANSQAGAPFYKGAIRFNGTQAHVNSGTQWAPLGNVVINAQVSGSQDAVDQNIFIADRAYTVALVSEVHSVKGTDGSAVTLDVKKCTGTQAAASGASVLGATKVDLKGNNNTVQSPALTSTTADLTLAAGDRLAIDVSGTLTAVAGGVVTVVLIPA